MASYKVNEIFYSLQGEGRYTGVPAVFIRLAGCNLRCPWCDTDFANGTELTIREICDAIQALIPKDGPRPIAVITGGEPTLQLKDTALIDALHTLGMRVHIETNGTVSLDSAVAEAIDWITCSPKSTHAPDINRIDELKIVFDGNVDPANYLDINITHPDCRYLQPCDTGEPATRAKLLNDTIEYIKAHPQWRLSLQTHKLLDIK